MRLQLLGACLLAFLLVGTASAQAAGDEYSVRQITFGPQHHFFAYIGQAGTVPWNASGRYIVALQVGFQDHLPAPDEAAEIVLKEL